MSIMRKAVISALPILFMLPLAGCTDGVRQTFVPYLTSGLNSIADGLVKALESELYPENSSSSSSSSSSG